MKPALIDTMNLSTAIKTEEANDVHDIKARRHLGDIYEQVLNDLRSAGNAGEFFTPRLPPPSSISKSSSIRTRSGRPRLV